MSRAPSEKTQLANLRREIKSLSQRCIDLTQSCTEYRNRATRAEQSCAEWKQRFDKLLEFRKLTELK